MRNAIISISDRTGIIEFAKKLSEIGFNIIATSGTQKFLSSNGVPCKSISEITGFSEILSGRVKTLHPKIIGAILADNTHITELKGLGIEPIELVVCNLYPFDKTPGIDNIDIGGVTLIRAAAKNYKSVACVTHPSQYDKVESELVNYGKVTDRTRVELAREAFKLTSSFDIKVAEFLGVNTLNLSYEKVMELPYGENPHQKASLYKEVGYNGFSIIPAVKLQGKELSFNNLYDLDAALCVVKSFSAQICACILKHSTPCGVAVGDTPVSAYKNAYRADPISPFGGVVAFNYEVDKPTAEEVIKTFITAIIAPGYTSDAKEIFVKKKNMVVMQLPLEKEFDTKSFRWLSGGLLVQDNDIGEDNPADWSVVTNTQPTHDELKAMEFGFKVVRFIKSNAVCVTTDRMTLGIGSGQPNRIGALEIALNNMQKFGLNKETPKAIASDAFFPFRDSIDLAARTGIKAIIQPGGSIRDQEVISACNEHGIVMILTHKRHFRH